MVNEPRPARVTGAVERAVEHVDGGQRGHGQGHDPQHRHSFLEHLGLPPARKSWNMPRPWVKRMTPRIERNAAPSIQAVRAERIDRSGRRAPRYWPVSVLAATEKAVIVRKAIASQRIATPCAAVATAPSRLIRRRNQSWQRTLVRLSPAAGKLIRRSRRIRSAGRPERGPSQAQAGAAPDQDREHEAAPDPLAAGRADGDPGQPERTDRPPAHGQQTRSVRY